MASALVHQTFRHAASSCAAVAPIGVLLKKKTDFLGLPKLGIPSPLQKKCPCPSFGHAGERAGTYFSWAGPSLCACIRTSHAIPEMCAILGRFQDLAQIGPLSMGAFHVGGGLAAAAALAARTHCMGTSERRENRTKPLRP